MAAKLERIGDVLEAKDWILDFAELGVDEIETLLAKHAALLDFLRQSGSSD